MDYSISMPLTFPVTCHTNFVGKDSIFVAIQGYADNGINYVKEAIEKGARTIVVHHNAILDDELYTYTKLHNVIIKRVSNPRKALAELSAKAAGFPAKQLKIIGITGTKGKTTTAFLLEHILQHAGYKTALISSAHNKINNVIFPPSLTTPQPDYLHQFLKLCVENTVDYVVMEVAAQALTLHRVEGITFCGIIFTNFSHEHLEFYSNLDDYFRAKYLIFNHAHNGAPLLINSDNKYSAQLLDNTSETGKKLFSNHTNVISYGFYAQATTQATHLTNPIYGITIQILHKQQNMGPFTCFQLFGEYNAYNIFAAASMAFCLHVHEQTIKTALSIFPGVPGRLQQHALPNGARSFIDYAHNPESFKAILSTLRALTDHLIVVFGAGGGRDKSKRPIMGVVATEIADIVIITSDNPRLEDPEIIAQDIIRDVPSILHNKIVHELDRKKAIEYAYQLSDEGSIIALLGKGPDEYQIIGTKKIHFSEKAIIEQL